MPKIINVYLERAIKWLLLVTAFIPLAFSSKFLYPYIVPKAFFAKGVIQIALALSLILFLTSLSQRKILSSEISTKRGVFTRLSLTLKNFSENLGIKERVRNTPKILLIFGTLFIVSQALSTIFAEFPYRAFWGTLERGGGFFNFLHFVILFALVGIFFRREDFERYFKFSLVAGAVVYFYAVLQAIGFTEFPFAFGQDARPGSFIGNGAFLAAYSFFVIIAALITVWFSKERKTSSQKLWLGFSIVVLAVTPIIIFLTRTRGAIIGLGASVLLTLFYFVFRKLPRDQGNRHLPPRVFEKQKFRRVNPRTISIATLIVLVVFGATLFLTRSSEVWQKIPGLDRIAQTISSFNIEASLQTRISSWKLATNAFFEKPILGWGPEHYLVAFEKRNNSDFDAYGEVWLDRAHNSILDIAATQGLLGLISYIGLLVILFRFFFRGGPNFLPRFFIGAIFLGFTAQNIFLLEEFHVFAPFFVLVGAVATGMFNKNGNQEPGMKNQVRAEPTIHNSKFVIHPIIAGGSILIFVATVFVIYKTNLVPMTQAYYAHKLETIQSKEEFFDLFDKATKPYNFAQYSIRSYLHDFFYANQGAVFTNPELADAGNKFVESIREVLLREGPYDIRSHIRLSQAYQEMAKQNPPTKDPIFYYQAGEEILREALKISPFTQELIYGLGFALTGQERYEEAIDIMGKSIALSPQSSRIARLHFYYGLMLVAAGHNEKALKEFEEMKRTDPQLTRFSQNDIRGLFTVYESLGQYERIIEIITESARGYVQAKIDPHYYEIALSYHLLKENGEAMIVLAEFIAKKFPERKSDMETIIDLVKNSAWDILHSL